MNSVVSRWLPVRALNTPSSSDIEPVNVAKGTSLIKRHGSSTSPQATPVAPSQSNLGGSSPVKRVNPSDISTQFDLIQQYEIIQALLGNASFNWSNDIASSLPPLKNQNPFPFPQRDPQNVYLVSRYWWDWFHKAYLHASEPAVLASGIKYGMHPVDNQSMLVDPKVYGSIRRGLDAPFNKLARFEQPRLVPCGVLLESVDCVCVPREVWENCLVQW